jgi:hypothetical protein
VGTRDSNRQQWIIARTSLLLKSGWLLAWMNFGSRRSQAKVMGEQGSSGERPSGQRASSEVSLAHPQKQLDCLKEGNPWGEQGSRPEVVRLPDGCKEEDSPSGQLDCLMACERGEPSTCYHILS